MEMTVDVYRGAVCDAVDMTTAYLGAKVPPGVAADGSTVPNMEAYDRVATIAEDRDKLDEFFDECFAEICERIQRWLTDADGHDVGADAGAGCRFVIEPPRGMKFLTRDVVKDEIRRAFEHGVAARWLMLVQSEHAAGYAQQYGASVDRVVSMLMTGERVRRRCAPF